MLFHKELPMTKPLILLSLVASLAGLSGCSRDHPLDNRYVSVRPNFGNQALPNPGDVPPPAKPLEMVNEDPVRNPPTPVTQDIITGTWTFTTPPTTTRVERKNATFSQTSVYMGRPKPNDTPLVVITVASDAKNVAESDPETYRVSGTRTYTLNGNIAKEWTGLTNGAAFNELLITRPGSGGDRCHAIAIARGEEQRKLAIEILGSITWKANETPVAD
jgi:hypothetical protein